MFGKDETVYNMMMNAELQLSAVLQKIGIKRMEDLNPKYYCFCRYDASSKEMVRVGANVGDGLAEVQQHEQCLGVRHEDGAPQSAHGGTTGAIESYL